jgi:DNA polymerase V
MLMDLTSATDAPQSLFAELQSPQSSSLDPTLDAINRRFGANTLRYAAVGFDHPWAMCRQFCSPRYTTCWNELPAVKVRV